MKKTLFMLVFITSSIAISQNSNIISSNNFDNIEINGVKFIDITNTHGDPEKITNLFGNSLSKIFDRDGNEFNFDGLSIGFSALMSSDNSQPIIGGLQITNKNSSFKVNGITITIGDNINKLGSLKVNNMSDGTKSINFMKCEGCNNFFSIRFNHQTNMITQIIYIEQT